MVKSQDREQRQQSKRLNMGSSNKNWTEMFKNKSSSGRKSATFPSVLADGSEERTMGPKPRWNPRPEQIQILNAIFNSGMVNPPREEISKIRAQLQEFGQAADVNVFYWFQNRKSRSKLKNRQQNSTTKSATSCQPVLANSSSSSSNMYSPNGVRSSGFQDLSNNSSGGSVNKNYIIPNIQNNQYLNLQANQVQMQAPPPNYYPTQQIGAITTGAFGGGQTPGQRFNEITGGGSGATGLPQIESVSRLLLGDQIMDGNASSAAVVTGPMRSVFEDEVQRTLSFMNISPNTTTQTINVPPPPATNFQMPSNSQNQGVGGARMVGSQPRSYATVHFNGVKVEVSGVHPFYVQAAFGEDAVLFYQSGHPVPTNNWGATLHPLQHGASYILKYFPSETAPNQFPFN